MTENRIREYALQCISDSQNNCKIHDDNVSYQYTVAFNDGVIALLEAILDNEILDNEVKHTEVKEEQVNHPKHYQQEGKKECIEQMREDYGDVITAIFCLTNAYKYLYRAGAKEGNPKEQDIAKAKWYFGYQEGLDYQNYVKADVLCLLKDVVKEIKKYGC